MMSKKRFVIRTCILAFAMILILFTTAVLWNAWYSYVLTVLVFGAVIVAPKVKFYEKKFWVKLVTWVLFAVILATSVVFCRSDMQVSFVANAYLSYQRFMHYSYNLFTGDILGRNSEGTISPDYDINDWTPPKGYDQTEIKLENSRGYFLTKDGGDHDKVVYYIHGGAYIFKYEAWYNDIVRRFSVAAGDADAFALDYRTAPEDVYPCALNDAVDGYEYLLEQGYAPENIIVAGDSAGGGLSIALTMYLRDNNYPMYSKLVVSSPWTDLSQQGDSYTDNITKDVLFGGYRAKNVPQPALMPFYAGDQDITDPYISPVYGTYNGFPPTLIIAGSDEMLLSDSLTAYDKLTKSGSEATLIVKHGMCHCYFIIFPWCAESAEAWETIGSYLQK